jgi:hypothetical protein
VDVFGNFILKHSSCFIGKVKYLLLLLPPFKGKLKSYSDFSLYFTTPTDISVSRDSSVSIVTWLRARRPEFDYRQGQGFFFFATASRLALGPTQSPIQWTMGALPPE